MSCGYIWQGKKVTGHAFWQGTQGSKFHNGTIEDFYLQRYFVCFSGFAIFKFMVGFNFSKNTLHLPPCFHTILYEPRNEGIHSLFVVVLNVLKKNSRLGLFKTVAFVTSIDF